MKILDTMIIKDKYDVVIIGAGIGGLTAAALLAKRGASVLLIEQHFLPGGCCSAIRRGGVTSDVGASLLFGFSEKGLTQHRFVHNCLEEPIDVLQNKNLFRLHWKTSQGTEQEVTVWRDFEKMIESLTIAFPNQEKPLRDFYNYLFKLYDAVTAVEMPMAFTELPISLAMKMFLKSPLGILRMVSVLNKTGKDLMLKFFNDPELIAFFDMIILTMNTVPSDVNPGLLSGMIFADCNRGGAYYPVGSPQMIPNKMEKAFEKYGGMILYRHKVEQILFDTKKGKPRAIGVRLQNGVEIMADAVVSNSNVYNFYGGLIPPELCKPGKIEETMKLEATSSVFPVYLSVDAEAVPANANPVEVYISNISDLLNAQIRFVFIPSLEDPSLAPKGVHSMTIIQRADPDMWPRPEDPRYQSEEYDDLKQKVADEMLTDIEQFFPNLKKHIRTMEIATPTTLERFTSKYKGNIAGPVQKFGQHLFKREHAKTKGYERLYMCGDSTSMGAGVVSACSSGVSVANVIIKDLKLGKPYMPKKFSKQYVNILETSPSPLAESIETEQPIQTETEAVRCARECNWCDSNRCSVRCPAGVDVNSFIRRIEVENFEGAANVLREMNPFALVCGYVCPSERFCESDCYRLDYKKESVRIKDLQKWVMEKIDFENLREFISELNNKKIAVIGSGPAGLSCAYYLSKLGYSVDIYEKSQKCGGIMAHLIPEFRLPSQVLQKEIKAIHNSHISFKYGMEFGQTITIPDLTNTYDAIFLAPGLWKGRVLNVPGVEKNKTMDALSFIGAIKAGEIINTQEKLLIIGGGSVAADSALLAKHAGFKDVILLCLECETDMPMLKSELKELHKAGVTICSGWGPKTFETGKVECIACKSVLNAEGEFSPVFDASKTKELEFDRIVFAVGQEIEPALATYLQKEFGMKPYISVNPETQLIDGKSNIYAGGDVVRGAGTIIEAVADGRRAAIAIHKIIGG